MSKASIVMKHIAKRAGTRFVVLLALLNAACTDADVPESAVLSVDTLPNGAIHVRNGVVGQIRKSVDWRPVELLRIGAVDDADLNYVFGDVWDVTMDRAGRVYVLDRQSKNVRVFAETGEHIRTLGREGGGPGEFTNPIGLTWDADGNLWVVDVQNARYTVFDTSGALVETYPRQIGGWGYNWGGGFDRPGIHLYEPSFFSDRTSGETKRVYLRHTIAASVAITDTFELPSSTGNPEDSYYRIEQENGYSIVSIP
jgi:6-bladed beta-propeller